MAKKKITEELVEKAEVKAAVEGYAIYADFELFGVAYKAGGRFVPPAQLKRDVGMEQLRNVNRPEGKSQVKGMAFGYEGEVIDKATGERESKAVILPLEEA